MTNLKTLKAAALAVVLGLGIVSSAHADRHTDKVAAAIVVTGLIGAAVNANRPVYYAPPAYVAPGYYEPAPVYYAPPPVYVAPSYDYGYRHNHYRHGYHHGRHHYR